MILFLSGETTSLRSLAQGIVQQIASNIVGALDMHALMIGKKTAIMIANEMREDGKEFHGT